MGVEFGFRGLPGGLSRVAPPAGVFSEGGVAALDGDTGVAESGCPDAPKVFEIPPWAAIDNDSTQDPRVLTALFFTSPLRPDMMFAPKRPREGQLSPSPIAPLRALSYTLSYIPRIHRFLCARSHRADIAFGVNVIRCMATFLSS